MTGRNGLGDRRSDGARDRDEGSVLAMTLVMTVVTAMLMMALLSYVATVMRVQPGVEERAVASETARSAVRQAVHQQRINGPGTCYEDTQTVAINGFDAELSCVVTDIEFDNVLMRNRFGIITTTNRYDVGGVPLPPIWGSNGNAFNPTLTGDVFVNGGAIETLIDDFSVTGTSSDGSPAGIVGSTATYAGSPSPVRYSVPGPVPTDCTTAGSVYEFNTGGAWDCIAEPWTARAGNNADPTAGPWIYPYLPSVPTQTRSSTPISIPRGATTCKVFYPGHYPNPIDIDGGEAYFASGVYYFEGPLTVRNGATVVGGEGFHSGCVLDSEAALYNGPTQRAPKVHSITGNGTTFLLGDDATVSVTRANMILNRRLSTETTRPSEGISIRSVNTVTTDTADVYVPEDEVYAQESLPVVPASTTAYVDSEPAGGWNSPIVLFDTTTGGPPPNSSNVYEFRALGAIFVPNATIELTANNRHYQVEITGGTTSTRLGLDLQTQPDDPAAFFFGTKVNAVQSTQRIDALVTLPSGRQTLSSVVMQLNMNREYALNSWTLDVGAVGVDPTNGGAGIP
ncbi:MAG: hypothetical protein HKN44_14530 [Ilumatobacter sp.]|nr:hypothetical protein [Ilumatobacter sp.]